MSLCRSGLAGGPVWDAGCEAGQRPEDLPGAVAVWVEVKFYPSTVAVAKARLPQEHGQAAQFASGDMTADHGGFDYVLAMDSLIYYGTRDITEALARLGERTRAAVVFTVAPKTPFLMTFWSMGKLFPRADRSPIMVPHAFTTLHSATKGRLTKVERVSRGFYISECLEYRP